MGLKAKFNLVLVVAFTAGLLLASAAAYRIAQDNARREVLDQAKVMMQSATEIRHYTVATIAPLLAHQMRREFLRASVPSWAAQTTLKQLKKQFPDYTYKEAALNPTNPADRATGWQAEIINTFGLNASLNQLVTTRHTPSGDFLVLARPFRLTDKACLACHSTPEAAPRTMTAVYGRKNGFGWKLGTVIGAQIVSVPMRVALRIAKRNFLLLLGGLAAVFIVMIVLMNVMLHVFIIKPVRTISSIASEVSLGNLEVPEYTPKGRDEISSLAASFNRMRRSLANAIKMIEASEPRAS